MKNEEVIKYIKENPFKSFPAYACHFDISLEKLGEILDKSDLNLKSYRQKQVEYPLHLLKQIKSNFEKIKTRYEMNKDKIEKYEKFKEDFYHFIEFNFDDAGYSDRLQILSKLNDKLADRRRLIRQKKIYGITKEYLERMLSMPELSKLESKLNKEIEKINNSSKEDYNFRWSDFEDIAGDRK